MRPPSTRALALVAACAVTVLPALAVGPASAQPGPGDPAAPEVEVRGDGTVTYDDPAVIGTRTVAGTVVEYVVESASGASSEEYAVETAAGRLVPVELRGDLPEQVAGGAVEAQVAASGQVASAEVEPEPTAYAAGSAPVTAHRAYVAKVTNAGAYADDDATVLGLLDSSLRRWVAESDGHISSFTRVGDVRGYAPTGSCTDGVNLWNQAAGLFPGVGFGRGTGNHLVVLAPNGCQFGLGTVGSGLSDGGRLVVSYERGSYVGGLVHEIGHNVGLGHAHSHLCTSSGCSTSDYGNWFNVMGITWSGAGVTGLDSAQRAQLGVAGSCETPTLSLAAGQRTVTATYDVLGRGTDTGTRGLTLTDPTTGTRYALDWRNRQVRDTGGFYGSSYSLGTSSNQVNGYGSGLTVERLSADGRDTTLLPSTESTPRGGRTYSRDPGEDFSAGGMRVRVDGTSGSGTAQSAQVTVTLTDPRVTDASPLPEQSGTVAVGGTPEAGRTLTAATSGWAAGTCFRYQWLADGAVVPGARQRTFTVPANLAGQQVSVQVLGQVVGRAPRTATSSGDPVPDPPSDPAPTPAPAPTTPAPAPTTPAPTPAPTSTRPAVFSAAPTPAVTGTARTGRTLRAQVGRWSPSPTTWGYRWSAGGRPIAGATGPTYRVGKALRGKRITVTVTGSRPGYATTSRTSRPTSPVRR